MNVRTLASTSLAAACVLVFAACGDDAPSLATPGPGPDPDTTGSSGSSGCSIPNIISGGVVPDGIPSLVNPNLVAIDDPDVDYLLDDDRVIGIEVDGAVIAMPHNIGWVHEIVNLEIGGRPIAITHCPLTGSSLAFDREPVNGVRFGVSGFLVRNNLIMFEDRESGEASLWPQMSRGARCGPQDGTALPMVPVVEMTWEGWRSLHAETLVVGRDPRMNPANYLQSNYYYGAEYLELNSPPLFPMPSDRPLDRRRPTKERVLGVPEGEGGIAFPFGELDALGPVAVVQGTLADGSTFVVLWDRARQSAMAYRPIIDDEPLALEASDGFIMDVETGSTWGVDGRASSGPLVGERLEPIAEAYMAFWFGWAAFQPRTEIWTADAV